VKFSLSLCVCRFRFPLWKEGREEVRAVEREGGIKINKNNKIIKKAWSSEWSNGGDAERI